MNPALVAAAAAETARIYGSTCPEYHAPAAPPTLTGHILADVHAYRAAGLSVSRIAERFGLQYNQVARIVEAQP